MKYRLLPAWTLLAALSLSACGGGEAAEDTAATAAAPPPAEPAPAEPAPEPEPSFDIARVPVSDAPLGDFPYFSLPAGYHTTDKLSSHSAMATFPFWVGDRYIGVEGRVYQANIRAVDGKTFSAREVEKNIEHLVDAAGGVKIAEMVIPKAASSEVLTREFALTYANGLCWPSEPVRTYVIHRTDKDIWVHACTYGGIGGAWVIAETATVEPTATLLPSSELRQRMDADGKVAVQITFASDSARILPGSQAQLEQIAEWLQQDPELRLAVNGHTDDTGTAERNRTLSQARATAVTAALAGHGIDASRLQAHGLGREQPVVDNGTPEGRAANRRVELVRQ